MPYNPQIHHRRSIRLKGYDYSQRGAYFVTLVTHGRQCLFGQIVDGKMQLNEGGEITHQCWMEIPKHYPHVSLDAFVIMPNHVHGIIIITENIVDDNNIANIVGAIHELPHNELPHDESPHDELPHDELPLHNESSQQQNELMQSRRKMLLSKIIGRFKMNVAKQINQIRQMPGVSVWQRNYYEHIIRNDKEMTRIREYIANNPLNWITDEN